MYFSKRALCNIPVSLSTPRFSKYLDVATSDLEAVKLYQWNVELSSAYYIPMHFYEIILRNTVSEAIKLNYGPDWHRNDNFRLSLDNNNRQNLASAIRNAKRTHNTNRPTIGAVIAESKFVFWEKMFTYRHDSRIWDNYFDIVFPLSDNSLAIREKRNFIYNVTEETRKLRNRIAHHVSGDN